MRGSHENNLGPASFLVENIELLPGGLTLNVAMGSGRNAVFLARMGFAVEGGRFNLAGVGGLEPPTGGFGDRCSTS